MIFEAPIASRRVRVRDGVVVSWSHRHTITRSESVHDVASVTEVSAEVGVYGSAVRTAGTEGEVVALSCKRSKKGHQFCIFKAQELDAWHDNLEESPHAALHL